MAKLTAGLLAFRLSGAGELEVLLVHPGGPFWANKQEGAWSIAKGEHEPYEPASAAADREFREELGQDPPHGPRIDLGEIRQPSGKRLHVFAVEDDGIVDGEVKSNRFDLEWPPRSGRICSFPEVDRAEWTPAALARVRLSRGQVPFVDRLAEHVARPS